MSPFAGSHDHSRCGHAHAATQRSNEVTLRQIEQSSKEVVYADLIDHQHTQNDEQTRILRKFQRASLLCGTFLVVEVIGGIQAGSLAILSDALHLAIDLLALGMAATAAYMTASTRKDSRYSFGVKRVESLAALLSLLSLAVVAVGLMACAVWRLLLLVWWSSPALQPAVNGPLMASLAVFGMVVNIGLALVLGEHHVHLPGQHCPNESASGERGGGGEEEETKGSSTSTDEEGDVELAPLKAGSQSEINTKASAWSFIDMIPFLPQNVNLRATYLHVLADLLQSIVVCLAGIWIWCFPHHTWIDPLCTLGVGTLIVVGTRQGITSALAVLLQEAPSLTPQLQRDISNVPGVSNVHDVHVWHTCADGDAVMSLHCTATDPAQALADITRLAQHAGIRQSTLQILSPGQVCVPCVERICGDCYWKTQPQSKQQPRKNIVFSGFSFDYTKCSPILSTGGCTRKTVGSGRELRVMLS